MVAAWLRGLEHIMPYSNPWHMYALVDAFHCAAQCLTIRASASRVRHGVEYNLTQDSRRMASYAVFILNFSSELEQFGPFRTPFF